MNEPFGFSYYDEPVSSSDDGDGESEEYEDDRSWRWGDAGYVHVHGIAHLWPDGPHVPFMMFSSDAKFERWREIYKWNNVRCMMDKKMDALVEAFNTSLDPLSLFLVESVDVPDHIIHELRLETEHPKGIMDIMRNLFAMFVSIWPPDERDRFDADDMYYYDRTTIEDMWPSRSRFMNQLHWTMRSYASEHHQTLLEFYNRRNWNVVRRHVRAMPVVWHWVDMANKPGSAGHVNGMRACADVLTVERY